MINYPGAFSLQTAGQRLDIRVVWMTTQPQKGAPSHARELSSISTFLLNTLDEARFSTDVHSFVLRWAKSIASSVRTV